MVVRIGDYEIFELMGTGSYSKVYRARRQNSHFDCALKVVNIEHYSSEDLVFLQREIAIAKELNHPNICKVFESFRLANQVCIVMELLDSGSILEYINENGPLPTSQFKSFFRQMVSAVQYLHNECGVIHRDLKCENWMLSATMQVKLIDFGFARHMCSDHLMSTICGSLHYTAPEIIKGEPYTDVIDVWSLGVVLYAMAKGELPFCLENPEKCILTTEPEIPVTWTPEMVSLVKGMLQKNPSFRWRINDVARCPFLNDENARSSIRQSVSAGTGAKILLPNLLFTPTKKTQTRLSVPNLQGRRHLVFTPHHNRIRAASVDPPLAVQTCVGSYGGGILANSLAALPEYRPKSRSPVLPL